MMKTSFIAAASLVLIAGIPLSAGAKPGEAFQREGMLASGRQGGGEMVLAVAGKTRGDDGRSDSDGRQTGNSGQGSSPGRSDDGRSNNSGGSQQGGSFGWLAGRDDRYSHNNGYGHNNGGGHDDHHGGGGHDDDHHGGGHHDDDHDASPCKPRRR